jgi:hypothetical protein
MRSRIVALPTVVAVLAGLLDGLLADLLDVAFGRPVSASSAGESLAMEEVFVTTRSYERSVNLSLPEDERRMLIS